MDVYIKCAMVHKDPVPFPSFAVSNIYSTNGRTWPTNWLGAYRPNNAKGGNEIPVVTEKLSSYERQKFQGSEIKLLTFWRIGMRTYDNGNNLT